MQNEHLSELILCNADNATIDNVVIEGSATLKNNGLILVDPDNLILSNVNSSDNFHGFYLTGRANNIIIEDSITNSNNFSGFNLGLFGN